MAAVGWRDRQSLQEITGEIHTIGGDGIFSCYQYTLPIVTGKEVWTGEQVRRFAACRESVEWSFNTLYQLFPVLCDWTKFRLLQTYPQYMIKTAFVMLRHQNDVRHFQAFIANAQTQTRAQVQLCTIRPTHTLFSPEIILTSLFPTVRIHLPQTSQNTL